MTQCAAATATTTTMGLHTLSTSFVR